MTFNTKISAGEVIVLTMGEYSSYGIEGYIVACVDFDIEAASNEFLHCWESHSYAIRSFIAWLIVTEKAVPITHREIHLCYEGGKIYSSNSPT